MKNITALGILSIFLTTCGSGETPETAPAPSYNYTLEMDIIAYAVILYHQAYGEFPKGNQLEIAQALSKPGANGKRIYKGRKNGYSKDGRLLDPWGTPYRIFYEGKKIIINSAGPDKRYDYPDNADADIVHEDELPQYSNPTNKK